MGKDLHSMTPAELVATVQNFQELVSDIESVINRVADKPESLLRIRDLITQFVHLPKKDGGSRYRGDWVGGIELRFEPDDPSDVDEVVLKKDGFCIHMERMDDDLIWLGIDDGENSVHVHLGNGCKWYNNADEDADTATNDKGNVIVGNVEITPTDPPVPDTGRTGMDGFHELFFRKDGVCYLHIRRMNEVTLVDFNDGQRGVRLRVARTERHETDVADWTEVV